MAARPFPGPRHASRPDVPISLMDRIIGHYPVISPTVVVIGNQSAVDGRWLGAPPGHGGLEIGGRDEGADFGVQVKAELACTSSGARGLRKAA
jgi:hypothetical protein